MRRGLLFAVIALTVLLLSNFSRDRQLAAEKAESSGAAIDPTGPNAACYVCHVTFVREELSKTHLRKKISCIKCHGLSARHANDENVGATKPDITYQRDQVNAACRKCHKKHDVPPEAVVARWLDRRLTQSDAVCTDCHGSHRIDKAKQSTVTFLRRFSPSSKLDTACHSERSEESQP